MPSSLRSQKQLLKLLYLDRLLVNVLDAAAFQMQFERWCHVGCQKHKNWLDDFEVGVHLPLLLVEKSYFMEYFQAGFLGHLEI